MANVPPIEADDFKVFFDRDFRYGTDKSDVRDADITKAINEAWILFNPNLFVDLPSQIIAFQYLTAHLMVRNFIATGGIIQQGQGLNSTGTFPISNKSAGPLSVGYAIPTEVADNPALAQYLTTSFGLKYLNLVMPNLIGNIANAMESTKP